MIASGYCTGAPNRIPKRYNRAVAQRRSLIFVPSAANADKGVSVPPQIPLQRWLCLGMVTFPKHSDMSRHCTTCRCEAGTQREA